ncbi:MAG: 16S rRNA (cytosine(1402)-N(4))-methyltransferase RsmH [Rhizobiales bacterium]|nr:16S rRNA (cytosine(1402)-N(4))-methyltransferase RsmH [Hyphomicrobiales bacterium]
MTAGSGPGTPVVAGGLARHIPVLARAAIGYLSVRDGGIYLDATFGAGGYARLILDTAGSAVLAIDRDPDAIAAGADLVETSGGRLTLTQGHFSELDAIAQAHDIAATNGVVLDVGVSSMQLDDPSRGFSFRHDGPLDMRMGADGPSAADVIAAASERNLAAVIATLGEERHARAVARAIVRARREVPIRTTAALADVVSRVVHSRPGDIHPATRTFQALRILVNNELGELAAALAAAERILKPGGRLVVVAFHSLEDRIVKTFLADRSRTGGGSRHQPEIVRPLPTFTVLTRRPVTAEPSEIAANPRARSAKLRAAERTTAPPRADDVASLLPRLPSLADILRGD